MHELNGAWSALVGEMDAAGLRAMAALMESLARAAYRRAAELDARAKYRGSNRRDSEHRDRIGELIYRLAAAEQTEQVIVRHVVSLGFSVEFARLKLVQARRRLKRARIGARERQVMNLRQIGLSNGEIAARLGIHRNSVGRIIARVQERERRPLPVVAPLLRR